jgi:hypothetical protein
MLRRRNWMILRCSGGDTLLVAVAVVGGSILIENSHRIDTSTPDDQALASAPADCMVASAVIYREAIGQVDEGYQVASEGTAPPVPAACSDQ